MNVVGIVGQSLNVPLSFVIDLSGLNMDSLKEMRIINMDEIARQVYLIEIDKISEMNCRLNHHLKWLIIHWHFLGLNSINLNQLMTIVNVVHRKFYMKYLMKRKEKKLNRIETSGVLTLEVSVKKSLCESIEDCQKEFNRRFVRSMEKNEKRSIPLTIQFDNGDQITTNLISHQLNKRGNKKKDLSILR